MFHYDGYTRGNHPNDKGQPRRPVRFFKQERAVIASAIAQYAAELQNMGPNELDAHMRDSGETYELLMAWAGQLAEINYSDRNTP